eukprot:XP_016659067.1 PREDICTED: uncharacterized protein LOC107883477 [Acyrthosiphon pisum]
MAIFFTGSARTRLNGLTTMDTSDTTVFRRRGNSCYKSIAMIAVIAGVYVSIVSVLRFGRFLAAFNTALPSDNDLLPSSSLCTIWCGLRTCSEVWNNMISVTRVHFGKFHQALFISI